MKAVSRSFRVLLFTFLLSVAASFSIPRNISTSRNSTASNDANWDAVVQRGILRWQQLQSGCFPDKENPETVESLQADNWQFTDEESRWPPQAEEDRGFAEPVTEFFGWTEDGDYYTIEAKPLGT